MQTTRVAVDLAKSVFQVAVSHAPGRVDKQHRLSRQRFRTFFLHHPPTHVLMEACGSAHHWGRELQTLGHEVSLLPPSHVARYRQGNKTDRADAKALLEAARNEDITPVPVKSLDQQAINALHRLRSGYVTTRTARINAVRGLLREVGILSATALVATVGDVHRFPSGRSFAAYLGLTPRESSSGGSRRLGPISKRGNRYLRVLLIHGARAARRDQRPFQRRFTAQEDAA